VGGEVIDRLAQQHRHMRGWPGDGTG
jgi:hypothetical protein